MLVSRAVVFVSILQMVQALGVTPSSDLAVSIVVNSSRAWVITKFALMVVRRLVSTYITAGSVMSRRG